MPPGSRAAPSWTELVRSSGRALFHGSPAAASWLGLGRSGPSFSPARTEPDRVGSRPGTNFSSLPSPTISRQQQKLELPQMEWSSRAAEGWRSSCAPASDSGRASQLYRFCSGEAVGRWTTLRPEPTEERWCVILLPSLEQEDGGSILLRPHAAGRGWRQRKAAVQRTYRSMERRRQAEAIQSGAMSWQRPAHRCRSRTEMRPTLRVLSGGRGAGDESLSRGRVRAWLRPANRRCGRRGQLGAKRRRVGDRMGSSSGARCASAGRRECGGPGPGLPDRAGERDCWEDGGRRWGIL